MTEKTGNSSENFCLGPPDPSDKDQNGDSQEFVDGAYNSSLCDQQTIDPFSNTAFVTVNQNGVTLDKTGRWRVDATVKQHDMDSFIHDQSTAHITVDTGAIILEPSRSAKPPEQAGGDSKNAKGRLQHRREAYIRYVDAISEPYREPVDTNKGRVP